MAKKSNNSLQNASQNKTVMVIILLAVGFIAGFLVARTRYKPQINTMFNMVMEKDAEVTDLKTQIELYEAKIMMEKELQK